VVTSWGKMYSLPSYLLLHVCVLIQMEYTVINVVDSVADIVVYFYYVEENPYLELS